MNISKLIKDLTLKWTWPSANLEFEKAADLRDLIEEIKSNFKFGIIGGKNYE
jgi:excinuclease UvrABC helicase subunit UvrB